MTTLTLDIARNFARIALGHVAREYPHKLDHVLEGDADALPPHVLHPVFFGSFDWHSCVHGWWTLLTLRRLFPDMPEAAEIEALADSTFTEDRLAVELAYLQRPSARGFERPYGWGWLLYLHLEAMRYGDKPWGERLAPLAQSFAERFTAFLPLLTYPITVGTHYNTSFALVLAREWAEAQDRELLAAIDGWTRDAFTDRGAYAGWEPGGDEFLSPVLTATLLMSRVLDQREFMPWFGQVLPDGGWLEASCHPVSVSDRSDGKIAHLDGLNLSRSWCLSDIARRIAPDARCEPLRRLAKQHLDAALPHVAGDYMGEHWLASFALLALLSSERAKEV